MKIPAKFQIFDRPVAVPTKDAQRLAPYLSGWQHLHRLLLRGVPEQDLQRLVIMELCGRQRMKILDRLLMRLSRVQWVKIHNRVKRLLA